MSGSETDELTTEEEADEAPYVEFDISVSPSDCSLELLSEQIKREDIIIPFYQRKYVWKIEQASKLIESFLMGLPVPQVFLYVNADDRLEVIDGQQRLMSIKYFMEGYFGEEDDKGKKQVFKLKGLSERSEFNGKTFADLTSKDQRKFRNSTLRAINIKQLKPSLRNDSVFHIFERLNTGGTQLKPQEIRNAVYRGEIVTKLSEFNQIPGWRSILGIPRPDKNQKDIELILRLFALFENWNNYEKPMLRYLNKAMDSERAFNSDRAARFTDRFPKVVNDINAVLSKPFRPRGVINSSVLEAVMITLLEDKSIKKSDLKSRYEILLTKDDFRSLTTGGTTDTQALRSRILLAKKILSNGKG